jgi:hypothetical protein
MGKYQRIMTYLLIFLPIMVVLLPVSDGVERYGSWFFIFELLGGGLILIFAYALVQLFRRINSLKSADQSKS